MEEATGQNGGNGGNSDEKSKKNDSALDIKSGGVSVLTFDYCVENFFAAMDSISALCGTPGEESFEESEIEQFSSMITFLKEWKQFVYEPKTVNFAYEVGSGQVKDEFDGISLSQFSSATVPRIEQSPAEARCLDSDFVLHVGGLVWALDWRPRTIGKPDYNFKCEYLAVAAHPPGSTYHKIGVPLVGRGIIQIWCLLTMEESVEFSPPRPTVKGRPRKIPVKEEPTYDSEGKEVLSIPRPRGRPKKRPIMSEDDLNGSKELSSKRRGRPRKRPILVSNCLKESSLVRPGGRPRKQLLSVNDLNGKLDSLSSGNNINLSVNECIPTLSVDLGGAELGMPVSADLNGKVESFVPRPRGRPRKKPIPSVNDCVLASTSEFGEDSSALPTSSEFGTLSENVLALPVSADLTGKVESFVRRRRGRPRKKPIPSVNECVQASGVELGDLSALPTSGGPGALSENVVALPVIADLNGKVESFVPMCRGSPRKKPVPSVSKCVPASGVEFREDSSSVLTSRGLAAFSENDVVLPLFADLNGKVESFLPRRRGRPRKKAIPTVNECVPASAVEFVGNSSVLPTSRELGTLSETGVTGRCQIDEAFVDNRTIEIKTNSTACINKQEMKDKGRAVCGGNASDHTLPNVSENELSPEKRENAVPLTYQTVDGIPMEICEGFNGGQLAIKNGSTTCRQKRRIKDKARGFSRLNRSNPSLSTVSEHKDLAVTVVPTNDDHCKDGLVLSEELPQKRSLIPKGTALPKVVLCLAHMGKVAWDVKWRPVDDSEGKHHLGYLAVLLGNGSLEVWEVPLPSMVKILHTSCGTEGTDPRFLKLKPIFRCSKVKCGDRQSIPLTVEWSPSAPHDLILAGCHDGTVALWKFSKQRSSRDIKPLLCFTADSVPIRALAWAPDESDAESANLIVTAGHEGLKFWDIRDPYRPLWDLNPVQRVILSLDWLKDPRCLILSFDDGTLRTLSLWKVANDVPVTGEPFGATKQLGLHSCPCSLFAIWSVQVSRTTGLVAYCTADGSARRFQLTAKAVEKDASRYRKPHFLCGSLTKEDGILKIKSPLPNVPLPNIPLSMKKPPNELGDAPRTICSYLSDKNQSRPANLPVPALCSGDDQTPVMKNTSKPRKSNKKPDPSLPLDEAFMSGEAEEETVQSTENREHGFVQKIEEFPPKDVAVHRVRWNMNKGSERWLCYGGAAGIIRCQAISLQTLQ